MIEDGLWQAKARREIRDERVRDLPVHWIECDEIWPFVYAKRRNAARAQFAASRPVRLGTRHSPGSF